MAKKAELLEKAKELKLEVSQNNTIAEIEAAINSAGAAQAEAEVGTEEKTAAKAGDSPTKPLAKSGKRSEKSLREAEAKVDKEARKAVGDTSQHSPSGEDGSPSGEASRVKKGPAPVTRPLVERRGKKYQAAHKKLEAGKTYSLSEAMKLATETSATSFDSSVELHVRLGVDPRQADQNIRATVSLPHGTGKVVRVAAFVADDDAEAAKKAGADVAGESAIVALLEKDNLDFDIVVATPQMMPKLGRYARTLGPRGLMPNPKSGTVATNAAQAIKAAKGGRVEYRVDKQSIVHLGIGKVSFGADKLEANAKAFLSSLQSVKPTSLKGAYVLSVTASTTMGPGIRIDSASVA